MRQLLVTLLLLSTIGGANTLNLEFAQEGEPEIPRAVIVIHNVFESRADMATFLQRWGSRSWSRDQYCSLYSYDYGQNGLYSLATPETLGRELYGRIRSGNIKRGQADSVNPMRRTEPTDDRQPKATTRGETELLFVGSGYGGLVARETARLARLDNRKVVKVVYLGSPLDGLTTIELILGLTVEARAQSLGLTRAIPLADLNRVSPAWWHLTELSDRYAGWGSYFAKVHDDALGVAAHGTTALPSHPTQNVLYGRRRRLVRNDRESDGFVPQPSVWAKDSGPIPWAKEEVLQGIDHANLTEQSGEFLIEHAVDTQITHGYLVRRQVIEQKVRGEGESEIPPIGVYWDERVPAWENAYASRKGLYEMLWLTSP
jgi:pimeloyl-ACP methyl ester carboxylesterase